jgi:autotransporter-associated beta strand protein
MVVDYVRYYAPTNQVYWIGSSSSYWTNSASWISSRIPQPNEEVVFCNLTSANSCNLGQDFTVGKLTFLDGSGYTINGGTLTLGSGGIELPSAYNGVTLNCTVNLSANQTWEVAPDRTLTMAGTLAGSSVLSKSGWGTLGLSGSNSFTGTLNVDTGKTSDDDGALRIKSSLAVANVTSPIWIRNNNSASSRLELDGSAGNLVIAKNLNLAGRNSSTEAILNVSGSNTLAGDLVLSVGGGNYWLQSDSGTLNFSGAVPASTPGGTRTLTFMGAASMLVSGTIQNGTGGGAVAVVKSGAGSLTLSGTNTFTGGLTLNGATAGSQINFNSPAAWGAGTFTVNSGNGGVVDNTSGAPLTLAGNNAQAWNNDWAFAGTSDLNMGTGSIALGGTRVLTVNSNNLTLGGVISGSVGLIKNGLGTLTLNGASAFTGGTVVNAGTLAFGAAGSVAASSSISINAGTVLDASAQPALVVPSGQTLTGSGMVLGNVTLASGGQISPGSGTGTLNLSNNLTMTGGATLTFDLSNSPGGSNDLLSVTGNLTLAGTNILAINAVNSTLGNGRYKLITCAARSGGATNFAVTFIGVPPQVSLSVDDSVSNEIALVVTAFPNSLVWQGDGAANNWNVTSSNWLNGAARAAFSPGDSVTLDDTSTNPVVNLVSNLAPGLVTLNGTSNYTFTGSGKISGACGFIKNSTGTLTVLTTNTYTGSTEISVGAVLVGNGTTAGSLGTGGIINNGALTFNHSDTETIGGAISGKGSFTKLGSGTMNLNGNNSFNGGVIQSGGIINASNSASLGTGPVLLTNLQQQLVLASGVSLNNDITIGGPVGVVGTGAIKGPSSGSATLNGQITLSVKTPNNGSTTNGGAFDGGNFSGGLVINGPIVSTGGGSVHLRANRITLSGGGSYNLFQDSGTNVLGADNGLATNAVLEIGSSAAGMFDLAGFNQTLNGLQKGGNSGTVGNSSTITDATLTISGVSSNTTFAGTIQNSVSGGTRKVFLTVSGGTFTLSAANTFSGDTELAGGTLALSSSTALQNSPLNLASGDPGVLNFGTLTSATIGGLKGSRNLGLTNSSGAAVALTVGNGNTNTCVYSGSLTGGGSVTKASAGTLILSGTNTFTGALNVDTFQGSSGNDGIVYLASPGAVNGAASIAIRNQNAATSTLQLDGTAGNISLAQNVSLNGRNPPSVAIENVTGSNTFAGNISFGAGGTNYYFQSDSGTLTFGGAVGMHSLSSPRLLVFQGSGNFLISGFLTNSAATNANLVLKNGSGTLTLAGTNLYLGTTTVNGGALMVNGVISTNTVTVAGGALGGSGLIRGPVAIRSGGTLSPGAIIGTTSTLTISNNLNLSGTTFMALNKSAGTNDLVRGLSSVTYGGTLSVTNLSGTLTTNDAFKIFSAASYNGAFAGISPAVPAPGFAWNTNTLINDGTLRILQTVSTTPVNMTNLVFGGTLTLSWPADHTGWRLQTQTNDLTAGLGTNWVDVAGSTATNQMNFTIDPANGNVFYRIIFP